MKKEFEYLEKGNQFFPVIDISIQGPQRTRSFKALIDSGAIAPKGLYEKDVVLDVAKKLGRILKEKYNMEVIFTRDEDVFIPLEERTAIANSKKADLFISIHANASPRKFAKGVETYILNWTDDDGT